MSQTSRIETERALYRPEIFEHQRWAALSEPVDERSLPALWCVAPAVLLIAVYWLFASATYRPRANGSASQTRAVGGVLLSIASEDEAFSALAPGDEVTLLVDGLPGSRRMMVRRTRRVECAAFATCWEVEGSVGGPRGPLAAPAGRAVPIQVLLKSRTVME